MLVRDRLKTAPSEEAVALMYGPRVEAGRKDFLPMLQVHRAHAVMLARQGIISQEDAAALLGAVQELEQGGLEAVVLDPRLEDLFYNIEAWLTAKVGVRVAGQLHTGRSRNDLTAAIDRMHVRDQVNDLCAAVIELRSAMLELARQHTETVMPGYTHLKPAQPITFGYYLSAVASALERDTLRVERVYESANLSPMGAAAMAGTRFPIDRQLVMRLLSFDGLLENCLDAVASRDFALELMAALALLTTTITRVASDIYTWQTDEFGMVELADAIAGTSSIMPQKKNPQPLESAKGCAPQVYGALMAGLAASKAVTFSNNGESGKAGIQQVGMAVAESLRAMRLLEMIVRNISVDAELMADRANGDFCSVTELADLMVRQCGVSFREAHAIVGGTVYRAVRAGQAATDITPTMLNEEAQTIVGREIELSKDDVRDALDPMSSVKGKLTLGGPAPSEVQRMVAKGLAQLEIEKGRLAERQSRLESADRELRQIAARLMGA